MEEVLLNEHLQKQRVGMCDHHSSRASGSTVRSKKGLKAPPSLPHCLKATLSRFFATPWTVVHQAPLTMGFSRQEDWSELLNPAPAGLTNVFRQMRETQTRGQGASLALACSLSTRAAGAGGTQSSTPRRLCLVPTPRRDWVLSALLLSSLRRNRSPHSVCSTRWPRKPWPSRRAFPFSVKKCPICGHW